MNHDWRNKSWVMIEEIMNDNAMQWRYNKEKNSE